jgi:hypothetical protein
MFGRIKWYEVLEEEIFSKYFLVKILKVKDFERFARKSEKVENVEKISIWRCCIWETHVWPYKVVRGWDVLEEENFFKVLKIIK